MGEFWLCFVPLFVAVDAIGALALFIGLTSGVPRSSVRHVIIHSLITAAVVSLAFVAIGRPLLGLLGITVSDFMAGGGVLLLVLSIRDLVASQKGEDLGPVDEDSLGAVPIGVPLIVGPAVLTTLLLLADRHGPVLTATAMVANVALAGIIFWLHQPIYRFLGKSGAKTVSKVASLLLASYGVMMIREGVMKLIHTSPAGPVP